MNNLINENVSFHDLFMESADSWLSLAQARTVSCVTPVLVLLGGFHISGTHKIVSSGPWVAGILFWYKKTVIPKKNKLLLHGTLKDWTKFTTRNNEKQKRKSSFLSRQFCSGKHKIVSSAPNGALEFCSGTKRQ